MNFANCEPIQESERNVTDTPVDLHKRPALKRPHLSQRPPPGYLLFISPLKILFQTVTAKLAFLMARALSSAGEEFQPEISYKEPEFQSARVLHGPIAVRFARFSVSCALKRPILRHRANRLKCLAARRRIRCIFRSESTAFHKMKSIMWNSHIVNATLFGLAAKSKILR